MLVLWESKEVCVGYFVNYQSVKFHVQGQNTLLDGLHLFCDVWFHSSILIRDFEPMVVYLEAMLPKSGSIKWLQDYDYRIMWMHVSVC